MAMPRDSHDPTGVRRLFFIGVILVASACADRAADEPPPETAQSEAPASEPAPEPASGSAADVQFAPALDVDLARMTETPTGLYIEDIQEGTGEEARPGQEVTVHYTGWLPNGEQFDSSHDRNEPYTFLLGGGGVIAGWEEGVAGMKPGGRRKLVVPPDLAYGPAGRPPVIPPNATLVFDVELIEAR